MFVSYADIFHEEYTKTTEQLKLITQWSHHLYWDRVLSIVIVTAFVLSGKDWNPQTPTKQSGALLTEASNHQPSSALFSLFNLKPETTVFSIKNHKKNTNNGCCFFFYFHLSYYVI